MLPRYHQHLVINFSIGMDEKANKLGHEGLLLVEGRRKGGDASGIPSLCSSNGRVYRPVEALYRSKLNSECDHEVGCLIDSSAIPISYIS